MYNEFNNVTHTIHCFPGSNGLISSPYDEVELGCEDDAHGESKLPKLGFSLAGGLEPSPLLPEFESGQPDSEERLFNDQALAKK